MKKKLIVAAVVAMIAFGAISAMATDARKETMGNQGLYLMDITNLFVNPATMAYHRNNVLIHMEGYDGSGDDLKAFAGGTIGIGDALTIGFFAPRHPSYEEGGIGTVKSLATNPYYLPVTTFLDVIPYTSYPLTYLNMYYDAGTGLWEHPAEDASAMKDWHNPFEIMLSYMVGDSLSLGISYYLANGKMHFENDKPSVLIAGVPTTFMDDSETMTVKSKLHSLKLGLSYKMDNIVPEAWFNYSPYSMIMNYEYNPSGMDSETIDQSLKGRKFAFGARVFYNMSDNMTIVPAINYEMTNGRVEMDFDPNHDYGPNTDETDLDTLFKVNTLITGVSLQYKADRLFLVGSAGLKWSKVLAEYTCDTNDIDYQLTTKQKDFAAPILALGIEYQATKLLTLRGGLDTTTMWAASTSLTTMDIDSDTYVDNSMLDTYQKTSASIGMRTTFGNLYIDYVLGNMFLVNEEGNDGDGPNLFSNIDIVYQFK